jgi:hypothetical protein
MRLGSLLSPLSPEALCVQAMFHDRQIKQHKTKEARNLELIDEQKVSTSPITCRFL